MKNFAQNVGKSTKTLKLLLAVLYTKSLMVLFLGIQNSGQPLFRYWLNQEKFLEIILMEKDSGLTKAEREMIVVATSALNNCQYCVVAHGAILRIRAKDPLVADQIAINYRKADITERQKAMLAFALKVSSDSGAVTEEDLDHIRQHGFNDEDIWDIGAITAFFALSNRMANLSSMRPNAEFYTMGR